MQKETKDLIGIVILAIIASCVVVLLASEGYFSIWDAPIFNQN